MKDESIIRMGMDHSRSEALRLHRVADQDATKDGKQHARELARDAQVRSETLAWVLGEDK